MSVADQLLRAYAHTMVLRPVSTLRGEARSDFITVEEAADRLGLSVATVRRRCSSGEIEAEKAGSQWLVKPNALRKGATRKKSAQTQDGALDFTKALGFIRSTDISELWVPDVLRYRDQLDDPKRVLSTAENNVKKSTFGAPTRVDVPKTMHSNRPGVLLDLSDRVAFQAVVQSVAPRLESTVAENVYSCRSDPRGKYFLEHGTKKWVRFKAATRDHAADLEPPVWVATTDISSYFEHIIHRTLFEELSAAGVSGEPLRALRAMLSRWALVEGVGLPQGLNASRVLGNFYLAAVDEGMRKKGVAYFRYMDDIRIVARSKAQAVGALREFERLCRSRGLTVSSAKTSVKPLQEYIEEDDDPDIDSADYFFRHTPPSVSRRVLKRLLNKALDGPKVNERRAKFSLWRLARIREKDSLRRVLDNLEHLAPIASVVAAFLKPFVARPHVSRRLEEFLQNPDRSYSYYLRSWIYAAILEGRSVSPVLHSVAVGDAANRNNPPFLRAVALCVVGKSAQRGSDLYWMKDEVDIEHDPVVLRALLVALTYGSSLPRSVANAAAAKHPDVEQTAEWLKGKTALPSLLYADQKIDI